jgi:UDP-glucose 4-epimerase
MDKVALITGGFGFLGRAVARKFKQQDYRVVGIGHGRWAPEEARFHGFDVWLNAGVSLSSLMSLNENFDIVVHCAGNGSVGYSLTNPLEDFYKTVQGTAELLEYLRIAESNALLVYPSSAGVYGAKDDAPIKESDALNPISPYGYHKKITEELLLSNSQNFGRRVAVIRFFSIYGPGLAKQLLWDASAKFCTVKGKNALFWGTGEETRDWISCDDAADLIIAASKSEERFMVLNGASGKRVTVRQTLALLKAALGVDTDFEFNQVVRKGDPRFYHADISKALSLGWNPSTGLTQGIMDYVFWLKNRPEYKID